MKESQYLVGGVLVMVTLIESREASGLSRRLVPVIAYISK